MARWFVYCGTNYYPFADVVEAENAREAVRKSDAADLHPVMVFPMDALALRLDWGFEEDAA